MERNTDKRSLRKQAKRRKAQKRQEKAENAPYRKEKRALHILIILLGLVICLGSLAWIYNRYTSTLEWSEHQRKQLEMAQQAPDALYDESKESKLAKENFTALYRQMIDEDTKGLLPSATPENLKTLEDYLPQIEEVTRQSYSERYNDLKDRITINDAYQDLFSAENTLNESTTPQKVYDLNKKYFDTIYGWYVDSNQKDAFANYIYELQENLIEDAGYVDQLVAALDKILTTKPSESLEVKADALSGALKTFDDIRQKLHFNWASVGYMDQLAEIIRPILTQNQLQHDDFIKYQKDLLAKQAVLENWSPDRLRREEERLTPEETTTYEENNPFPEESSENTTQSTFNIEMIDLTGYSKGAIEDWALENQLKVEFLTDPNASGESSIAVRTEPQAGAIHNASIPIKIYLAP